MLLSGCGGHGEQASSSSSTYAFDDFHAGVALMEQHNFLKAAERFEKVVAGAPTWYAAQFNCGLAYMNSQVDDEKARAHLETAARLRPDLPWAHSALGVLVEHLPVEGGKAAIGAFRKVVDLDPNDARANFNLGRLLLSEGRTQDDQAAIAEGLKYLERSFELDPYLGAALYQLQQQYMRTDREKAMALLKRFQELKEHKAETLTSTKYTEQGRYAEVIRTVEPELEPRPPAEVPVKFVEATETMGLPAAVAAPGAAGFLGVTVADLDGNDTEDLLLVMPGEGAPLAYFAGDGKGRFARTEIGLPATGSNVACLAGDYDRDGDLDVYLVGKEKNALLQSHLLELDSNRRGEAPKRGTLTLTDVTAATGTAGPGGPCLACAFADADHDGDLDLFVTSYGVQNQLLSNNTDGTFTDIAPQNGLDLKGVKWRKVLFTDVDGDHDTDILLLGEGTPARLFLNDRIQRYHEAPAGSLPADATTNAFGAATGDTDGDQDLDLLICRGPDTPAVLLENGGRGSFKVDAGARLAT